MRRIVPLAVAGLLALVPVSARPQTPTAPPLAIGPCCPKEAAYEAAVRGFASGQMAAAALAIAHAPAGQLKQAVSRLGHDDPQLLPAAAAMHLVLAVSALNGGNLPAMSQQLTLSRTAFQNIRRPSANPLFIGTWYIAAAELCTDIGEAGLATAILQQGLHEKINPAGLQLAEGVVNETRAAFDGRQITGPVSATQSLLPGAPPTDDKGTLGLDNSTPRRSPLFWTETPARRRALDLDQAERSYRQALQSDPTSEEARVRLARVLSLEGNVAEARTLLNGLVSTSHQPRILYLAHLFLADVAIRQKHEQAARREYKAALAANPSSRVPYFALSNLAQIAGNDQQAREYIGQWMAHGQRSTPDLWTEYETGTDQLTAHLNALLRMTAQ